MSDPTELTEERWQALLRRDVSADGAYFYAVRTTGIYCRTGCASRTPKRENVVTFETWEAAERAGFRPCKRCDPRAAQAPDHRAEAVVQACRLIDEAEQEPTLDDLAAAVGLSPYYFHRLFKETMGVTPKAYARQRRQEKLRATLKENTTVTHALYDAGYATGSRLYEEAPAALGMTPTEYRDGASGIPIRYAVAPSYLGRVLVAASDRGVCRIDFDDSAERLAERLRHTFPNAHLIEGDAEFAATVTAVLAFLESPRRSLELPLDIQGTAFQRRVWAALRAIPAGATVSYGDVAEAVGQPKAARAVAGACGANNLAVAIPCHRVVRGNGELGGYRWGAERKRMLLEREGESDSIKLEGNLVGR